MTTTMTYQDEIKGILKGCSGWCDPAKGIALADLVIAHKPAICLEIGVFSGKSLLSIAVGLREAGTGGVIYGVDSWATGDCTVDTEAKDADWWKTLDLEAIYAECLKHIVETKLARHIRLLRMSSMDATHVSPPSLDLLHIDGCHSEWSSVSDVTLWLPRLRPGGHLIMDDVNWPSTQTAVRFAKKWCIEIAIHNTPESVFGIFRKN